MPIDLESRPARDALEELSRFLEQGNLSVFVGAGLSVPAGIPTWKGLLETFAEAISSCLPSASTCTVSSRSRSPS